MRCKVLWIDDEYKIQADFIGYAEQEEIDIVPFESHEEGMEELKKDLSKYDAVILDAKVKKTKDDTVANLEGLVASRDFLLSISKENYIPFFIFTGQPDYVDAEMFKQAYGDFYVKGKDNENLLKDVKEKINSKDEFIIRKTHSKVFDVCTDQYIGENAKITLLEILKDLENPDKTKHFNDLRKILEDVFITLNYYELIPYALVEPMASTHCRKFLSGLRVQGYILRHNSQPRELIQNHMENILSVVHPGSHRSPEIENHLNSTGTNYVLQSTIYQLMEVIVWLKVFIDSNPPRNNWTNY